MSPLKPCQIRSDLQKLQALHTFPSWNIVALFASPWPTWGNAFLRISGEFLCCGRVRLLSPRAAECTKSKHIFRYFPVVFAGLLALWHLIGISCGDKPDRLELHPVWPLHAKFDSALRAVEVSLFQSLPVATVWQTLHNSGAGGSDGAAEALAGLGQVNEGSHPQTGARIVHSRLQEWLVLDLFVHSWRLGSHQPTVMSLSLLLFVQHWVFIRRGEDQLNGFGLGTATLSQVN